MRGEIRQFYREKAIINDNEDVPYADAKDDFKRFLEFDKKKHDLKPLNEACPFNVPLSDKQKISGKIEDLFKTDADNCSGTHLDLYCWMRTLSWDKKFNDGSKTFMNMPATNFSRKSVLLNMQKYILETHYEKRIRYMFIVNLHPNDNEYKMREASVLPNMEQLFGEANDD